MPHMNAQDFLKFVLFYFLCIWLHCQPAHECERFFCCCCWSRLILKRTKFDLGRKKVSLLCSLLFSSCFYRKYSILFEALLK